MAKNTSRPEIDSLSFEVENQELFQIKQKENSSVLLQNIDNILIWCYIYGEKYK